MSTEPGFDSTVNVVFGNKPINPEIDFKSVFGDGEGFTVAREMTPEELASAKPCPGDSVYGKSWGDTSEEQEATMQKLIEAKHPGCCECLAPAEDVFGNEPMPGMVLISDEMIGLDEQGRPVPPPGFEYPEDAEDLGGLTNEEFEAAVRKASEMSERALGRAEQALIKAEDTPSIEDAGRFMAIHDRWLRFAEVVAP